MMASYPSPSASWSSGKTRLSGKHSILRIHSWLPRRAFSGSNAWMHKIDHKDASNLLRVSQFLSLHAPDSPQTRHFLNPKAISLLPPGAIMVNTARGGLVVDDDLIAALKSGRVAAAGLDVFEAEPKLHPEYVSLKNTYLLPHIGSATIETRTAMGMLALDNVEAVLNGRPAPTLVPGRSREIV